MQFLAPSIFLNRIHQIHKENVKGNSCLMFFFNLCRYILTFSWKRKKKMNSLTSRSRRSRSRSCTGNQPFFFVKNSFIYTRLFCPHFSYNILLINFKDHSKVTAIVIEFIFKLSYSTMNVLIILSPFRSNTLVATHSLCLSRE